jgi:hypothetical protein
VEQDPEGEGLRFAALLFMAVLSLAAMRFVAELA